MSTKSNALRLEKVDAIPAATRKKGSKYMAMLQDALSAGKGSYVVRRDDGKPVSSAMLAKMIKAQKWQSRLSVAKRGTDVYVSVKS